MTDIFTEIQEGRIQQARAMIEKDLRLLEATDDNGNSLLHIAALADDPDLIYFLLTRGMNIDAINRFNATALFLAAQADKRRAVEYLIQAGANKDLGNQYQATPMFIAAKLGLEEVVQLLIDGDADPHIPNINNVTPLDIANNKNHTKIAKLINAYARRRPTTAGTEDRIKNILKRKTVH